MADLPTGGIGHGDKPLPWSEPDSHGCEYLIPLNSKTTRNSEILAEAQRRLDESGGQ